MIIEEKGQEIKRLQQNIDYQNDWFFETSKEAQLTPEQANAKFEAMAKMDSKEAEIEESKEKTIEQGREIKLLEQRLLAAGLAGKLRSKKNTAQAN